MAIRFNCGDNRDEMVALIMAGPYSDPCVPKQLSSHSVRFLYRGGDRGVRSPPRAQNITTRSTENVWYFVNSLSIKDFFCVRSTSFRRWDHVPRWRSHATIRHPGSQEVTRTQLTMLGTTSISQNMYHQLLCRNAEGMRWHHVSDW